jgi:DNA-directed RNA polymerase specialized sigma24 family protein
MSNYEQQLLETAKNGGVEAFEKLTDPHQVIVYNFLLKECGNEFEAGQLTQEVFVRTFDMLTKKADIGNLYACIYRTAAEIGRQAACESKKLPRENKSTYASLSSTY